MSEMKNIAVCDLRHIRTAQTAKEITAIKNVALLLLPKDAPEDVSDALQAIPKSNVATMMVLEKDIQVQTCNGKSEITAVDCASVDGSILLINGLVVMHPIPAECNCQISLNGLLIAHESLRKHKGIRFFSINGMRLYADFDHVHFLHGEFCLDADFLQKLPSKTLLLADKDKKKKLTFARDVTPELLEEKKPIIRGEIVCPKKLLSALTLCCIDCSPKAARW